MSSMLAKSWSEALPPIITVISALRKTLTCSSVDAENQRRVKTALQILPEKTILELGDADFRDYTVVRVSDEILVDVMTAACGIEFEEASKAIEIRHVDGVPIPFARAELLLRMNQTYREKDSADRIFLHEKIERRNAATAAD